MGLKTFGLMGVDWEERVNLERLRQDRLSRIKAALKKSELGALLCFDMNKIRKKTEPRYSRRRRLRALRSHG